MSVAPPAAAPWERPGETPARRVPLSTAVSMEQRGREKLLFRDLETSCYCIPGLWAVGGVALDSCQ